MISWEGTSPCAPLHRYITGNPGVIHVLCVSLRSPTIFQGKARARPTTLCCEKETSPLGIVQHAEELAYTRVRAAAALRDRLNARVETNRRVGYLCLLAVNSRVTSALTRVPVHAIHACMASNVVGPCPV